jgi:hypothetical protein
MMLFLDDVREPNHCLGYMHTRTSLAPLYARGDWTVVRTVDEFKDVVRKNTGKITHVSFDHDLVEEHYSNKMYESMEEYYKAIEGAGATGLDAAKWFKIHYQEFDAPLPVIIVHSMNPVGTKAIKNVFGLL